MNKSSNVVNLKVSQKYVFVARFITLQNLFLAVGLVNKTFTKSVFTAPTALFKTYQLCYTGYSFQTVVEIC